MQASERSGVLAFFVRHHNAANLLMVLMLIFGLFGLRSLNTQFFPTTDIRTARVQVSWPGASAEAMNSSVLEVIRPAVRYLDGVTAMRAVAKEGTGSITLEYDSNIDMNQAVNDLEKTVRNLNNLPEDIETPEIWQFSFRETIGRVLVTGPFPESSLREYAYQIRDGLLDQGVPSIVMSGMRTPEIRVDIGEVQLRRLGLTVSDISVKLSQNIRDIPLGALKGTEEQQVRMVSGEISADSLRDVEIVNTPTGEMVVLGDVANITPSYKAEESQGLSNGKKAIQLEVRRTSSMDTLKLAQVLEDYIPKIKQDLPKSLEVEIYDTRSDALQNRINLLVRNGTQGLVLVLLILFLFLDWRIAIWVAAGIPVAMIGTFGAMSLLGQSINMISLFALIMTLGIIVDDAIVVGEHTATRYEMGDHPYDAAIRGGGRMIFPVMAASLTTIASFGPLLLVRDVIGQIISTLPVVVIAVLIASIIECFLILPGHMGHWLPLVKPKPGRFRENFDKGFDKFKNGPFLRLVKISYRFRYVTVSIAIASLMLGAGMVIGKVVKTEFFPSTEPEFFQVSMVFQQSSTEEMMIETIKEVEDIIYKIEQEQSPDQKAITRSFGYLDQDDNVGRLFVYLTASELRDFRTKEFVSIVKKSVPKKPGVDRINTRAPRAGPRGRDLDIRLEHDDVNVLKLAAEELKAIVETYPGVSGVDDDLPYGKPEINVELTPRGKALGFTLRSLGKEVGDILEGSLAGKVPNGNDELNIRVYQDIKTGGQIALRNIWVRAPNKEFVPLSEVAYFTEKRGFSKIVTTEGQTRVAIRGNIDKAVTSSDDILAALEKGPLLEIAGKYGVTYTFAGIAEEQGKAFQDLTLGIIIAFGVIYVIIAWVFASYFLPFAVMLIIPFGVVGAIFGHYFFGISLSILSAMGLLGLSGILVNDSIVLVSTLQERLHAGQTAFEAAIGASKDRLRAVILTSLTTIGGLTPLLFEKSLQAQFLIPMAVTIVFGLAAATLLVLFIVPAFVGIGVDLSTLFKLSMFKKNQVTFSEFLAGVHHHIRPNISAARMKAETGQAQ